MKHFIALTTLLIAGSAYAVEKPKSTTTVPESAPATAPAAAADGKAAEKAVEKKVRYRKSQNLQLDSQSVEGKLQRPEASLVTASEGVHDNGLLRLREDFLDKFTTFAGEEIQQ